jgi:hypothetical protein
MAWFGNERLWPLRYNRDRRLAVTVHALRHLSLSLTVNGLPPRRRGFAHVAVYLLSLTVNVRARRRLFVVAHGERSRKSPFICCRSR